MPNNHQALEYARRPGNGARVVLADGHDAPHRLTSAGVNSDEPAIGSADIDPPLVKGQTAWAPGVAQLAAGDFGYFRVVAPQQLAAARVHRVHQALVDREVHHAIHRQWHRGAVMYAG